MTHYEMVELLREKANVSYEEAKDALEATNWDLLDAIVLLEREGKTQDRPESFSTKAEEGEEDAEQPRRSEFRENLKRVGGWIRKGIDIGNRNMFVLLRRNEVRLELPLTAFAVLVLFTLPGSLFVLVAGLFFGFRYSFRGPQVEAANPVMDKASAAAEKVREEFQAGFQEGSKAAERDKQD